MFPARSKAGPALLVCVVALALLAGTATARTHGASGSSRATGCGSGALLRLRTLSDSTRKRVNFNPKDTTIGAIAALTAPRPTPTSRTNAFERQVWQVTAQITSYRLDPDGTIRLVLFEGSSYMNAEMPSPSCLSSKSLARKVVAATRGWFVSHCGKPTAEWQPLGVQVKVNGAGYWAPSGAHPGEAPNHGEIAPVIGMHPLAGCGAR
jgi:hypothetical protein